VRRRARASVGWSGGFDILKENAVRLEREDL